MKDKTHMEYLDTLINTLKIELKSEMNKIKSSSGTDVSEEVNALDLSLKQVNQKLESLQAEFKKLER
jgi:hypothetical protein